MAKLTRVSELSDLIGLSKVSIYKKLKLEELKPFIVKDKGITYLTKDGVNLIKKSFGLEDKPLKEEIDKSIEIKAIEELKEQLSSFNNKHIDSLNLEIESLKKQLSEKDKQIEELHKLIENNQVLLKQQQDKEINQLKLEEHFEEVDEKLMELKEKLINKEETKKGFFGFLKK